MSLLKESFTVKTWLPIFSGFYGTIWEEDGGEMELDYINEKRAEKNLPPVEWDAVEWDWEEYKRQIVEGLTHMIGGDLKELGLISLYGLEGLHSPREYNFYNDSIHVEFTLTPKNAETIAKYLREHSDAFQEYLKEKYTSYDGFFSSYSNDIDQWARDYREAFINGTLKHQHKLASVLQFILLERFKEDGGRDSDNDNGLEWQYREDFPDYPFIQAKNFNELVPDEAGA